MRIPHDCDDNYDDDDVGFVFVMNIILIILVLRWSWLVALTQLFLGSCIRIDRCFCTGVPYCTVVWDNLVWLKTLFMRGIYSYPANYYNQLNPLSCIGTHLIQAIYSRVLFFFFFTKELCYLYTNIFLQYFPHHFFFYLFLLHIYIIHVITYVFLFLFFVQ